MNIIENETIKKDNERINNFFILIWRNKDISKSNLTSLLEFLDVPYREFLLWRNSKNSFLLKRYHQIKEAATQLKELRFEIMQHNEAYDETKTNPKLLHNLWIREHKRYESELKKQEIRVENETEQNIKIQIKQEKEALTLDKIWKK